MSSQLRTVLLTILTLSVFAIAIVEIAGISSAALFNKYGVGGTQKDRNEALSVGISPEEAASRQADANKMARTDVTFYETHHSFGEINNGQVVQYSFRFKNVGQNPLLISKVDASCGCTVPSHPKEPIAPGNEGEIVVQFNSTNRIGHQMKAVTVHSNARQESIPLEFDADVLER